MSPNRFPRLETMLAHRAGTAQVPQISTTASSVRTRQWRSLTVPPSSRTTRAPVTMRPRLRPPLRSSTSRGMTTSQARMTRDSIARVNARFSRNSEPEEMASTITTTTDSPAPRV